MDDISQDSRHRAAHHFSGMDDISLDSRHRAAHHFPIIKVLDGENTCSRLSHTGYLGPFKCFLIVGHYDCL